MNTPNILVKLLYIRTSHFFVYVTIIYNRLHKTVSDTIISNRKSQSDCLICECNPKTYENLYNNINLIKVWISFFWSNSQPTTEREKMAQRWLFFLWLFYGRWIKRKVLWTFSFSSPNESNQIKLTGRQSVFKSCTLNAHQRTEAAKSIIQFNCFHWCGFGKFSSSWSNLHLFAF